MNYSKENYKEISIPRNYIFDMNFKDNKNKNDYIESEILIGKKFLVKADISNCFPSIYSHAIPWALVGKSDAKKKRQSDEWFNQIDLYSRNLKDGETTGILIGSHASNIISEIILVAIDKILYQKGYKYVRYIDDYKCYIESYEKAEQFLLDLSVELGKYNLSLNHKKTEILKLPVVIENWTNILDGFYFTKTEKFNDIDYGDILKTNGLKRFLDLSIQLNNKFNDTAIINYSIKNIHNNFYLLNNAQEYYGNTVLSLCIIYTYLISILDDYVFPNLNEALCYCIFFAIKYNITISEKSVYEELKENNEDCIILTLD